MHCCRDDQHQVCEEPAPQSLGLDGGEEQQAEQLVVGGRRDAQELAVLPEALRVHHEVDLQGDTEALVLSAVGIVSNAMHLTVEVNAKDFAIGEGDSVRDHRANSLDLLVLVYGNKAAVHMDEGVNSHWAVDMVHVENLV